MTARSPLTVLGTGEVSELPSTDSMVSLVRQRAVTAYSGGTSYNALATDEVINVTTSTSTITVNLLSASMNRVTVRKQWGSGTGAIHVLPATGNLNGSGSTPVIITNAGDFADFEGDGTQIYDA